MPWIPVAAAGVAAAGSIAGGLIGASGDGDAKDIQRNIYRGLKDYRVAGRNALADLIAQLEAGPGEFKPEEQPGYMYGYQQLVENPTLRSASVRGRLFDPSTQKALGRGAMDYASQQYDNFLSRYYQRLQPTMTLAGMGQNAAAQTGLQMGATLPYQQAESANQTNSLLAMINSLTNIGQKGLDWYKTQNQLTQPSQTNYQQPLYNYLQMVK